MIVYTNLFSFQIFRLVFDDFICLQERIIVMLKGGGIKLESNSGHLGPMPIGELEIFAIAWGLQFPL